MTSLLSSFDFFATGTGIIITCVIAAAMILFWDWRFSLIGLVVVQFGVAAVAVNTGLVQTNLMIVQVCIIALCTLILALSSAQTSRSPTIRQSGNGLMRLLTLILLYTALRLFDFDFVLPLPEGIGPGQGLQITVFFIWLCLCAILTLSLSNNPLFTAVALLLWCVPAHLLASLLIATQGISILIGIIELLLALGCSYLILTESFSTDQRPIVATDITFPVEERRMLTDSRMVPIGEMTTMDIPAVPMTPQARQSIIGSNLPNISPRGTVLAETKPTANHQRTNQQRNNPPQNSQPEAQAPKTQQRVRSATPLTRTNLKAVQKRATVPQSQSIPNQLDEDMIEPTQPTPNLFSPSTVRQPNKPSVAKPSTDQAGQPQQPAAEKTMISRMFKRKPKTDQERPPDKHDAP